jgi:hypothetical protein
MDKMMKMSKKDDKNKKYKYEIVVPYITKKLEKDEGNAYRMTITQNVVKFYIINKKIIVGITDNIVNFDTNIYMALRMIGVNIRNREMIYNITSNLNDDNTLKCEDKDLKIRIAVESFYVNKISDDENTDNLDESDNDDYDE